MDIQESQLIRKYHAKKVEKIGYGWSNDEKYHVTDTEGNQYIVRLCKKEALDEKKQDFRIILELNKLDFEMSQAIEVGYSEELDKTYMVLTWVEGEMMSQCVSSFEEDVQFRLGVEAGQIQRKIHQVPVNPIDLPNKSIVAKKLKQLDEYIACPDRVKDDEYVIQYVRENIGLLEHATAVYKHGDFHLGNLILTPDKKVGVIDFDRIGCGEGYEEFYKLQAFEVEVSIPFAVGKLKGYFGEEPPEEFWKIQKFYVAHSSLYSIKWAKEFGQNDVDGMVERYRMAAEDYDNFRLLVPKWFSANTKRFPLAL
jgi:aminoglycoside phosphotransferase (APT) family kinase protein